MPYPKRPNSQIISLCFSWYFSAHRTIHEEALGAVVSHLLYIFWRHVSACPCNRISRSREQSLILVRWSIPPSSHRAALEIHSLYLYQLYWFTTTLNNHNAGLESCLLFEKPIDRRLLSNISDVIITEIAELCLLRRQPPGGQVQVAPGLAAWAWRWQQIRLALWVSYPKVCLSSSGLILFIHSMISRLLPVMQIPCIVICSCIYKAKSIHWK